MAKVKKRIHPPHLPPKSCSLELHKKLSSLWWVLFLIGVAALAGIATALATIAWIAPYGTALTQFSSIIDIHGRGEPSKIDSVTAHSIEQRLVTLYDTRKRLSKEWYPNSARMGQAVLLSSDGWAVAAMEPPTGFLGSVEVVDDLENRYRVTGYRADAQSGLTYFKINASGFRAASFSDIGEGSTLFGTHDDFWQIAQTDHLIPISTETPLPISNARYQMALSGDLEVGAPLFTTQGHFVGFVTKEHTLQSAVLVEYQLKNLLEKNTVTPPQFSAEGIITTGFFDGQSTKKVTGLYITTGQSFINSTTTLRIGDAITKINGKPLDPYRLQQQLLSLQLPATFTLFRNGLESDILIPAV